MQTSLKPKGEKRVYSGIDICKLIAAALVVLLHTVETTEFYSCEVKFVFTRFAVPFFFIASGFFFCSGLDRSNNKREYFFRYERNLIKIFSVWALIIYTPFTIYGYIKANSDESAIKIILLLFRRIFVIGPGPYWYLIALMVSAAFLYLCHIKLGDIVLIVFMIIGFVLHICYASFQGVLSNYYIFDKIFKSIYFVFSFEFNFLMCGIPFMGIGYLICKKGYSFNHKTAIFLFIIFTGMRIVEYNLPVIVESDFWNDNNISIAFIPQSIAFFMFAKGWEPCISKEKSLNCRQLSSFIYFFHAIFLYEILDRFVPKITSWRFFSPRWIIPKWFFVVAVCWFLYAIIKKINNRHLNILING